MKTKDFKRGMQIMYGIDSNCELGFVTSTNDMFVFCRFWGKSNNHGALRKAANSEACNPNDLKPIGESVPQEIIEAWLKYLEV